MRLKITRLLLLICLGALGAAHAQDSAPSQEPLVQPPDRAGPDQDPDPRGQLPRMPSGEPQLPPEAEPVPLEIPVVHEEEPVWSGTLERIATGVVSIRVDSTRAFDTEWNSSSQATGFVVDAKRGIILTNRHVVTPGPVVAEAIFLNNEEVSLKPIYRDPVHDFGFFRYDPDELQYIEPAELPLVPRAAGIGREIRVVGNDAGEQLSILAGTIARLDRRAPEYGRGKYNDFNTFYLQAASGTSGGSSGSPVIDISGQVVALNAGANNTAASSFFLPLDRIERVLHLLQDGKPVSRGSLQTVFLQKPYDELRRLGLQPESEAEARMANPRETGMLTVQEVIPTSPADTKLQAGDILLRVDGKLITTFVPLAEILDNKVGENVTVEVERGGRQVSEQLPVSDLHEISPHEYLEFGDAVVNNLSYQQARHYNRPVSGVYVANAGYMLSRSAIPRGAVISEVGGVPVQDIHDLEQELGKLADGDRATIRYHTMEDPENSIVRAIQMDRTWFPARYCFRNDVTGSWPCRDMVAGPSRADVEFGRTEFPRFGIKRIDAIAPSLVMVNFDLPYAVSGVADRHYYGTGLIVDRERGFVLVDRNTVPVSMGDVSITFAGSLQIKGKVEYVHPLHNLAIVSYDPGHIGDTRVRAAEFAAKPLQTGDRVWVVGLKSDHQLVHQESTVASVDPLVLPLSRTLRFRDANLEVISLVNAPSEIDGVLIDDGGRVAASWSSFAFEGGGEAGQFNRGISSDLIRELVEAARSNQPIFSLEAEVGYAPLFAARKLGLGQSWLEKLEDHDPRGRRALSINRVVAGTPAAELLRNGDMLLAIDGQVVTSFRELEMAVQKPRVTATVWRDGKAQDLQVETVPLHGSDIDRAVSWAGTLLQNPHRALAAQRGIEPAGVYIAYFSYGSPATRYGLWAGRRIVAVNDIDTPDLQSFIDVIEGQEDRAPVRLKTVTWNGAVEVITLKLDNQYWPAYEIRRTDDGWRRAAIG
jgi:S1-C subfamily serine protease